MALCCDNRCDCLLYDLPILYLNDLKRFITYLFLLFWVFYSFSQCAMCRAVLENEAGQTTAKGVNDGIVYLMLIPYVLIGGLAFFTYLHFKKVSKKSKNLEIKKNFKTNI